MTLDELINKLTEIRNEKTKSFPVEVYQVIGDDVQWSEVMEVDVEDWKNDYREFQSIKLRA